jgi:hypothetical protein
MYRQLTNGTRFPAVLAHPSSRAPALPIDVVALAVVLTVAPAQTAAAVSAGRARLHAEETGVTGFALALPAKKVAGSVT